MLPKYVHKDWEPLLTPLLKDPRMDVIRKTLSKGNYFPYPSELVFRAFELSPKDIRVVIVGQDPYKSRDFAHGLAFSIPHDDMPYEQWPPSLQEIAKNVCHGDMDKIKKDFNPNLEHWMYQGVLLLNKSLTTGYQSHEKIWDWFAFALIERLNLLEQKLIFYLLGNPAKQLRMCIDTTHHELLQSIHPAAVKYDSTKQFDGKFIELRKYYNILHGTNLDLVLPF